MEIFVVVAFRFIMCKMPRIFLSTFTYHLLSTFRAMICSSYMMSVMYFNKLIILIQRITILNLSFIHLGNSM